MIERVEVHYRCDWCERPEAVIMSGPVNRFQNLAAPPENWTPDGNFCSEICRRTYEVAFLRAMANCAERGEKKDNNESYPGHKAELELMKKQRRKDVDTRKQERSSYELG